MYPTESPVSWSYQKDSTWRRLPVPLPGLGPLSGVASFLANLPLLGTILALIVLLLVGAVVLAGVVLFVVLGPISIPKELPSATAKTTTVYAPDGSVITSWHGAINRQPVALDRISKYLPQAVVAEEDARYYSNPGIDVRSAIRAAMADLRSGKVVEGGSTITQQYVKVAFVGNKPSLGRKILEARIALEISRHLSKNEIMNRYLNTVYFGNGAYGAQAAARAYFGKDAADLSISQAAMLAGIIHSPDHDSPLTNAAGAEADRLRVVGRMEGLGQISHAEADQVRADKPTLVTPVPDNPHLAWFLDALRAQMIQRYGAKAVYEGGLQIHTTVDAGMQAGAEATLAAALPNPADPYAALVTVDPATGFVKAVVGGRAYGTEKFNIATMGRRQPGSAFKPFVLAAALEHGISPQAYYQGPARLCLKGWIPGCVSNFGGESFGGISVTDATVNSVNTVYAQLILQVGPKAVVDVAKAMGIPAPGGIVPPLVDCRPAGSDICQTYLPAVPSLALGSASVTPLEMASAYATFAAGGVYRAPKLASQVVDATGKVLDDGPSPPVQAIPSAVADQVTQILQQVITRGTGTAAAIGQPAAGKTGTATDYRNAWFVGYTSALATATWVGYRDTNQPLLNVEGVAQMTGGTIPAKIWSNYMKGAVDTSPPVTSVTSGPADGTATNQKTPSFGGAASDDDGSVTSVEASVDGGPFATAGVSCAGCPAAKVTWSYVAPTALADGSHTFAFRSIDTGQHDSPLVTRTVTVDTVPPVPAGVQATGGGTTLTLAFSKPLLCSSLAPANFSVLLGNRSGTVTGVSCPGTASPSLVLTLSSPPRGGDQVAVTVVNLRAGPTDQAGNPVADPRTVGSTASNVAPVAGITGGMPDATLTSNAQPGYQGTTQDPDGNVTSVVASVDGGPFSDAGISCQGCFNGAPVGGPASWSWRAPQRLADGTHTIAVRAVDNAAAVSPAVTRTVTVDTVPPRPTGLEAPGGSTTVAVAFSKPLVCSSVAPTHFTATSAGRSLGVTAVSCDGPEAGSLHLTLTSPVRGGDQVDVTVASFTGGPVDRAGNNVGDPRTVSGTATNVGPRADLTGGTPDGALTSNAQPTVQGSAVDPDGNVMSVEASVDGSPFSGDGVSCQGCFRTAQVGGPVTWTWRSVLRLPDGPHTIAVRAVDNAAADSAPVSRTVTVDTVAPKATGLQIAGGSSSVTATFSKPLLCSTLNPADVSVVEGNQRPLVSALACKDPASDTIGLTLATPPRGGEQVQVTMGTAATDQAGNRVTGGAAGATAPNRAPALDVTSGGPLLTSDPRPSFQGSATDLDGSVARVEASLDGGPFGAAGVNCSACSGSGPGTGAGTVGIPVSWSYQAARLAEGPHTLVLRSVDNGGATSPEVTRTVVVDTSIPVVKAVMAAAGSNVVSVIFNKPVMCSSVNVGNFSVTVDGAPATLVVATCLGGSDAVVDLGMSQAPSPGQAVKVSLDRPVMDDAGNRSAAPVVVASSPDLTPADLP
jgi:penicillin-binding protein 1A